MEMWGRWCQFDDDSAFRVRVVGISGHGEENLPGPGLAISDKGGLCRVFSPAAPIFVVQGTVVGTARQNISMVGCCRLPFGTASRSVRVLLKVPYLHYFSPLPRPSLHEKTRRKSNFRTAIAEEKPTCGYLSGQPSHPFVRGSTIHPEQPVVARIF